MAVEWCADEVHGVNAGGAFGSFIPTTDIGRLTVDRPTGNLVVSAIRGTAAILGVSGSAESDPQPSPATVASRIAPTIARSYKRT